MSCRAWFHGERTWADLRAPEPSRHAAASPTPRASHNPKVAGSNPAPLVRKAALPSRVRCHEPSPRRWGPVRRTSRLLLSPRSTMEGSRRYARGHLRSSERSPKLWPGRCESHTAQVGAREPQRCRIPHRAPRESVPPMPGFHREIAGVSGTETGLELIPRQPSHATSAGSSWQRIPVSTPGLTDPAGGPRAQRRTIRAADRVMGSRRLVATGLGCWSSSNSKAPRPVAESPHSRAQQERRRAGTSGHRDTATGCRTRMSRRFDR